MHAWNRQSWTRASAQEQLAAARAAAPDALPALVRSYDWDLHPEPVLGWVMGQKDIDLGSAVTGFFNGTPERFNHLPKRDVPEAFQPAARLLDNICLRVNCGLYIAEDIPAELDLDRLRAWMRQQSADRQAGAAGRWVLDEQIMAPLMGEDGGDTGTLGSVLARAPRRRGLKAWITARLRPGSPAQPIHPAE